MGMIQNTKENVQLKARQGYSFTKKVFFVGSATTVIALSLSTGENRTDFASGASHKLANLLKGAFDRTGSEIDTSSANFANSVATFITASNNNNIQRTAAPATANSSTIAQFGSFKTATNANNKIFELASTGFSGASNLTVSPKGDRFAVTAAGNCSDFSSKVTCFNAKKSAFNFN